MKIEKSNNPVAVGALVLVLVLIVGRILWMVFGHGGPAAAASTISTGPTTPSAAPAPITKAIPAPAAVSASKAARASSIVLPATTRNPFSVALRPPRAVLHPDGLPRFDAMHRAALNDEIVPFTGLPPFPVRISGLKAGAKQPWAPHGPSALLPHKAMAEEQAEALPPLKLTATVGGTEPLAVVQTTNPEPVILHVGDPFDGMRVVAIHEQEVVFARGNGFWTLPLQSAADSVAAGSTSVITVPAASQPVVSVAAPQEKIDELE